MRFLIIADQEELAQVVEHAKRFNPDAELVYYPQVPEDLSAIFVAKPKRKLALEINRQRLAKGLGELPVVEVPIKKLVSRNPIRNRIIELLRSGPKHGYALYKEYCKRFGKISLRLFYYHLHKGLEEGIFELASEQEVQGDFSWGRLSRRKYYKLKV